MSSAFEKHTSPMDELLAMQQSALQANLNKASNIQKAVTLTESNWMGLTQAMELTGNSIIKAQETLERLDGAEARIYRTDLQGTVVVRADGQAPAGG